VPDFGFPGPGVRLTGTVPGSPAEKAGMKAGDTIVRVGSAPVGNLKDFSEILKTLQPGNRVSVTFVRDGAEHTIETEVIAR
jgi:S1-C subfamily serine protease